MLNSFIIETKTQRSNETWETIQVVTIPLESDRSGFKGHRGTLSKVFSFFDSSFLICKIEIIKLLQRLNILK